VAGACGCDDRLEHQLIERCRVIRCLGEGFEEIHLGDDEHVEFISPQAVADSFVDCKEKEKKQ